MIELLSALDGLKIDLAIEKGDIKTMGNTFRHPGCKLYLSQEGVTPEETLYLIGNTKIFLASSPQFKFGATTDLYTALLMGAYTFHSSSEFLEWGYGKDRGVFFYPYQNKEAILERAKLVLAKPELFQEEVNKGRQIVLESETWLNRAQLLIDFIPSILGQPHGAV